MPHAIYIPFLFALGACIGSFLNVVVWRVPRKGWGSLVTPPSHCPRCKHRLAWYDNVPVLGWIMLRGRCRYCREPISARYPIVEFIAGSLFVFYYVMFFMAHAGPCAPEPVAEFDRLFGQVNLTDRTMTSILADWRMYALYMAMISALLAVSLIDIDLYIIPSEMPWAMAAVGLFAHAVIDHPAVPGALNVARDGMAGPLAAGGAAGLLLSIVLFQLKVLPQSFAEGEPAGEVLDEELYQKELAEARREGLADPPRPRVYTRAEIRREIGKEMLFLTPPLLLALVSALLWLKVPAVGAFWRESLSAHWLSGLLGAALGAMVGGLIIWLTRILGTLAMGRIAMGLGDIHLLFGIGAILGAGAVSLTFFLAPFVGLVVGIWQWVSRRRHELPYGPYLSMAAAASLILYCPVAHYLGPGFAGLGEMIRSLLGG